MAFDAASSGERVGLVVHEEHPESAGTVSALVRRLPSEPGAYARLMYRTLHDLDDEGVDVIVAQAVPEGEAWATVADRQRRGSVP
jgi:L-threonylcarbamoyladenylate synthase